MARAVSWVIRICIVYDATNYASCSKNSLVLTLQESSIPFREVRPNERLSVMQEFVNHCFVDMLGGVMAHSPPVAAIHYEKLRVLLQMLVELERANVENVRTGRKKDLLRANDVIGTAIAADANVLADDDEVVIIARQRLDDINLCVHRIVNQLHISP